MAYSLLYYFIKERKTEIDLYCLDLSVNENSLSTSNNAGIHDEGVSIVAALVHKDFKVRDLLF